MFGVLLRKTLTRSYLKRLHLVPYSSFSKASTSPQQAVFIMKSVLSVIAILGSSLSIVSADDCSGSRYSKDTFHLSNDAKAVKQDELQQGATVLWGTGLDGQRLESYIEVDFSGDQNDLVIYDMRLDNGFSQDHTLALAVYTKGQPDHWYAVEAKAGKSGLSCVYDSVGYFSSPDRSFFMQVI